jgi:ATP-dependent RNA helicase RhlE
VKYNAPRSFEEMPIHPKLKQNIADLGYENPTEIQDKTFETVADIEDVIGIANTGTGKTGAFLIPIIHNLLDEEDDIFQTLVVLPTRELAEQVEEEFRKLAKGLGLYTICCIGGTPVYKDIKKLRRFQHIVVGTPGRLCDLVRQGVLDLSAFSILVIDEFDRLLDMGFKEDVFFLADKMNARDQTLLFSATIEPNQEKLIQELMEDPIELKVSSGTTTAEHITQEIVRCSRDEKFDRLLEMLETDQFEKVLIFAETKRTVGDIAYKLKKEGIRVDEIHGDKSQAARKKALAKFKADRVDVLVATDVAARGLDISDVTQVINFEIPRTYDSYIHRIGRTGRAGKKGHAYTFVTTRGKDGGRGNYNKDGGGNRRDGGGDRRNYGNDRRDSGDRRDDRRSGGGDRRDSKRSGDRPSYRNRRDSNDRPQRRGGRRD